MFVIFKAIESRVVELRIESEIIPLFGTGQTQLNSSLTKKNPHLTAVKRGIGKDDLQLVLVTIILPIKVGCGGETTKEILSRLTGQPRRYYPT